ncbi:hypothetical protein PsorP6_011063 [Peronosclerospora sorghi]|uniref:Uncharacterized protein n=1 Tax=Peronosclerospora sorghi TaxID=230839 RepID=A0ACC0VVR9_9STRA|nr:hypothetical protein PsorP6_011063 [Peronosclerospora sorghi]
MKALELAFWRKPLPPASVSPSVQAHAHAPQEMARTLGLFDLLMIGIGGTVGSGVFATAGLIARTYAGPAATLSWLLAGLGCLLSSFSFMELACRIPSAGSTYAYAYHAVGELPAFLAGFLLTLEYGVASAGGARSWSDKLTHWMHAHVGVRGPAWMKSQDSVVDVYAGLLIATCTGLILSGTHASTFVVNLVTCTKITVVLFIIVVGLWHMEPHNLVPFVPDAAIVQRQGHDARAFGWSGVLVGASASFFGYIGYDEVCCLAGEAKAPGTNIPRAVVGTVLGAAALSILATLSLVGMQKYTHLDAQESYGTAFASRGLDWAASFVATGEVVTMPITTFIGFLAQPRVQYAMATDGLLPAVFASMDDRGCLVRGTLVCGACATLLAVFVPFHVLWNFISSGILVAFNLTNTSLLLLRASRRRTTAPSDEASTTVGSTSTPGYAVQLIGYLVSSFLAAFLWQKSVIARVPLAPSRGRSSTLHRALHHVGPLAAVVFTLVALGFMLALHKAEKQAAARKAPAHPTASVAIVLSSTKPKDVFETSGRKRQDPSRAIDRDEDDNDTVISHDDEDGDRHGQILEAVSRSDRDPPRSKRGHEKEDGQAQAWKHIPDDNDDDGPSFRAPFVPFTPCVAIFFNWFLLAQMDGASIVLILLWLLLAVGVYFGYSRHSSLASQQTQYHQLAQHEGTREKTRGTGRVDDSSSGM